MPINSSNSMNLPVPVVGQELGPAYAVDINNCMALIAQHNHSTGQGVQINPNGIFINSVLAFNNNPLSTISFAQFQIQASVSAIGAVYVKGVDLFYRDVNNNEIQITSGGSVNGATGTITGLPSGSAGAAYNSGSQSFIFSSATSTPANINGASIKIRNLAANSFGVTLQAPSALGADYALVLPTIPAQTNVVTLDSSGNFGSTTWNAVANNRTRTTNASTVGVGGVAKSTSCGNFTTGSLSAVDVTNLSVTITTSGRPVFIGLIDDVFALASMGCLVTTGSSSAISANFYVQRDGSTISGQGVAIGAGSSNALANAVPVSSFNHIDTLASAGTYTYTIQASAGNNNQTAFCTSAILIAYEL